MINDVFKSGSIENAHTWEDDEVLDNFCGLFVHLDSHPINRDDALTLLNLGKRLKKEIHFALLMQILCIRYYTGGLIASLMDSDPVIMARLDKVAKKLETFVALGQTFTPLKQLHQIEHRAQRLVTVLN